MSENKSLEGEEDIVGTPQVPFLAHWTKGTKMWWMDDGKEAVAEKVRFLAERVMGWERRFNAPSEPEAWFARDGTWIGWVNSMNWNPYESIEDAWMVLQKVREDASLFANFEQELDASIHTWEPPPKVGSGTLAYVLWNLSPAMICDAAIQSVASLDILSPVKDPS